MPNELQKSRGKKKVQRLKIPSKLKKFSPEKIL
jgi:hypothetical protein